MTVETPTEPAYYYECSYGRFRLTYFIPFDELQRMVGKDLIDAEVTDDFPDGVDLDCTEADFDDFKLQYGYRPKVKAELLRDSFFTLFSTTREWTSFHGTGFVKADAVEGNVETVEEELANNDLLQAPDLTRSVPVKIPFEARRNVSIVNIAKRAQATKILAELDVGMVDSNKTIQHQPFVQVPMSKGKAAEEVFQRLHSNRNRGQQ